MQKLVIFEGIKGAGKSVLIDAIANQLPGALVLTEEDTLEPIRHAESFESVNRHYLSVLEQIGMEAVGTALVDRFHYTSWPVKEYDRHRFDELEGRLVSGFEAYLFALEIQPEKILERLRHTQAMRHVSGWKLNYDGAPIEEEADRDIRWQGFFREHHFKDTRVRHKFFLDTTDIHERTSDLQPYVNFVLSRLGSSGDRAG